MRSGRVLKGSEGSLARGKGAEGIGLISSKKDTSVVVALEPNRCIRKTIVRVSDFQDGGFDNIAVDLTVPAPPALSRRRRNPPRSTPDMMSAELFKLPLINWIHP